MKQQKITISENREKSNKQEIRRRPKKDKNILDRGSIKNISDFSNPITRVDDSLKTHQSKPTKT
jgi:hypothetical protein